MSALEWICKWSNQYIRGLKGIKSNSQPVRKKKKIEKTHAKEKQSHAQDSIDVVR